jgi:hypothetical protein
MQAAAMALLLLLAQRPLLVLMRPSPSSWVKSKNRTTYMDGDDDDALRLARTGNRQEGDWSLCEHTSSPDRNRNRNNYSVRAFVPSSCGRCRGRPLARKTPRADSYDMLQRTSETANIQPLMEAQCGSLVLRLRPFSIQPVRHTL